MSSTSSSMGTLSFPEHEIEESLEEIGVKVLQIRLNAQVPFLPEQVDRKAGPHPLARADDEDDVENLLVPEAHDVATLIPVLCALTTPGPRTA
jgi:hypothetical protein